MPAFSSISVPNMENNMLIFATSALSVLSSLFYVNEPVVDMRENPTHESKVVSQVAFSEKISVEKENQGWSYIVSSDGYKGWVPSHAFLPRNAPYDAALKVSRLMAHVYGVKDTEYGPIMTLPYGAKLQAVDTSDARWTKIVLLDGKEGYIQNGDLAAGHALQDKKDLVEFSQRFLGLPYTWGGRSSFGYDCSGFVQMLYSQIGIALQRDAKQQVLDERFRTVAISDLEPGDLIFFGKSEQRIMHVGMYIGNGNFIHSTAREYRPWIRISSLSDAEWFGQGDVYYPFRMARQLRTK